MKRLTKNNYVDDSFRLQNELNQLPEYKSNHYTQSQYNVDLWNKVKEIEDIEKELGIDLITLFKAINQKYIFVKEHNTEEKEIVAEYVKPNFINCTFDFIESRKEIGRGRPFSMYGKTWALTKENLEDYDESKKEN